MQSRRSPAFIGCSYDTQKAAPVLEHRNGQKVEKKACKPSPLPFYQIEGSFTMLVSDYLGHGAENAISAATLAAVTRTTPRELRRLIMDERKRGALILYRLLPAVTGRRTGAARGIRVLQHAGGAMPQRFCSDCTRQAISENPSGTVEDKHLERKVIWQKSKKNILLGLR